jgi:hypothetical protein
VFFGSTYTAEHLTTHRDCYLHVEQVVFVFCFSFFLLFECKQECKQLTVRGGGFLLSRVLFLVILLVILLVLYLLISSG